MILDVNRHVGFESRKAYRRRCETGFWHTFARSQYEGQMPAVLDIGYMGGEPDVLPILPKASGLELDHWNYEGRKHRYQDSDNALTYDGETLPAREPRAGARPVARAAHPGMVPGVAGRRHADPDGAARLPL
jgi:hypothetical protein